MKRTAILFYTLLPLLLLIGSGQALARKQWTEKQAWKWQEEVGVIKGFNEPNPAYPSMTRVDVLCKAHEVGLNSVRFWVRGRTSDDQIRYIQQMIDDADQFGMTVSPVISCVADNYWRNRGKQPMQEYEATVRKVIRLSPRRNALCFGICGTNPAMKTRRKPTNRWIYSNRWCSGVATKIRSSHLRPPSSGLLSNETASRSNAWRKWKA